MMWRASREARYLHSVDLPVQTGDGVLVGAFGLGPLRELSVWRRLVRTSLPGVPLSTVLIAPAWSPRELRAAGSVFPPSDLRAIEFIADPGEEWVRLLAKQEGEDTFAAVIQANRAAFLVVGGPTDEAWDRLEEAVQAM